MVEKKKTKKKKRGKNVGLADTLAAKRAAGTVATTTETKTPEAKAAAKEEKKAAREAKEVAEASDFHKSAMQLEALRDGRLESDIPLQDPYWAYRNSHTLAHGAHKPRVDVLETVKGRPLTEEEKASVVK